MTVTVTGSTVSRAATVVPVNIPTCPLPGLAAEVPAFRLFMRLRFIHPPE